MANECSRLIVLMCFRMVLVRDRRWSCWYTGRKIAKSCPRQSSRRTSRSVIFAALLPPSQVSTKRSWLVHLATHECTKMHEDTSMFILHTCLSQGCLCVWSLRFTVFQSRIMTVSKNCHCIWMTPNATCSVRQSTNFGSEEIKQRTWNIRRTAGEEELISTVLAACFG